MKFTVVLCVVDKSNPSQRYTYFDYTFFDKTEAFSFIRDHKYDFCNLYLSDCPEPVSASAFVLLFDLL